MSKFRITVMQVIKIWYRMVEWVIEEIWKINTEMEFEWKFWDFISTIYRNECFDFSVF